MQLWLTINYDKHSTKLNVDSIMKRMIMKNDKKMHDFINRFETIVANLKWNETTMCSTFRKKSIKEIFDIVYLLHSKNWLKTFAAFKTLTQNAENHFRIEKRTCENNYNDIIKNYQNRKRMRFSIESKNQWNRSKFEKKPNRYLKKLCCQERST